MTIKFSVVIATFNSDKTIKQCIESILDQDYSSFELIVIDNQSNDETLSIVESYNDSRIKFISEKDLGIYDAWNKGLKIATGDFIHFLGSDDHLYNTSIYSKVANKINDSCFPDALFTSINVLNKKNDIIDTLYPNLARNSKTLMDPFMGIFFKNTVFSMLGGFNIKYKICGDYDFILRFYNLFTPKVDKKIISINMLIGGISSSFITCNILSIEILQSSLENRNYKKITLIIPIIIKTFLYRILYEILGDKKSAKFVDFIRKKFGRSKYWSE